MLFHLPFEIGDLVFTYLPQSTLGQLCLANQQSYTRCLPHLYHHVHIKIRREWNQLDLGLKRSPILRQTVSKYTKQLTLTCCQSSYRWLITESQAAWVERWMPKLTQLTFKDFVILPVERIAPFLMHPSVRSICLRYCNLTSHDQPEPYITMIPSDHDQLGVYRLPALYYYPHEEEDRWTKWGGVSSITHVKLDRTDFSSVAVQRFFTLIPDLTHCFLGANHNRIKDANTFCLESLLAQCPNLHTLHLDLQQLHPPLLTRLVTHYGPQLLSLNLNSHDPHLINAISRHCSRLVSLDGRPSALSCSSVLN